YLVAPLGIAINLLMMLFLPLDTWIRLFGWLAIGLVIYAGYGFRHAAQGERIWASMQDRPVAEGDYYRSDVYRWRLRFSLGLCLFLLLVMGLGTAWLTYLWRVSRLVVPLQLCSPLILVLSVLAITA